MKTDKVARIVAAAAFLAALAGCAASRPPFPIPEEPGLYALDSHDKLQRLDGDQDWEVKHWPERANLSPDTRFVILDPAIGTDTAAAADRFQLWRVAWVRSEIGDENLAMPTKGSPWAVAPIVPFGVPVNVLRAPRDPAVLLTPNMQLTPGLYDLRLAGNGLAHDARLGILWPSVEQREYSAHNCVDRYTTQGSYRTCTGLTGTQQAMAVQGLTVTLVDPTRGPDGLVVQGVVTNTTEQTKMMPLVQVTLHDQSGQEIGRRVLQPSVKTLAPGDRMTFRTAMLQPSGPAQVKVTLVPYPNAGL